MCEACSRRWTALAGALCASIALAACSGGRSSRQPTTGAAVFAQDCSGCHSLVGNESLRRQGGDLLNYRIGAPEMLQFVREMPTRKALSSRQVRAVAAYVLAAERAR
jgi:mono/diheme cytochrome c family protein